MSPRQPYPFAAPRFAMLLRCETIWVRFADDGQGGAVTWLEEEPEPPLDDYERGRVDQRAAQELAGRQGWWREQHETRRLNRRIALVIERGGRL